MKIPYPFSSKTILLSLLALGVGSLIFYNVHDIVFGTSAHITTAVDGAVLNDTFLPVTGSAPRARSVSINGRSVAIDKSGYFNDGIILSMGYNVVEVAVLDRFGKEKKQTYSLVVDQPSSMARANTPSYQQ
jgi:hypothetical protein